VGVGLGTLVLGTGLALLVAFYDFPGRRTLEWALVLPLAMPGYVLAFVLLGQFDAVVNLRTPLGGILVLTATLYPYVYLLARAAFVGQGRSLLEAARSLGLSHLRSIVRVALPLARPAIAAGVALAVMEALADFGTVNLLGIRAFTDAIYRVWYGAFDRQGALQLGTMLLGVTLLLLMLERLTRRRARYEQVTGRGHEVDRRRLSGARAALALGLPLALLVLVFGAPVVQLVVWSARSIAEGTFDAGLLANARNSILLAFLAGVTAVTLSVATVSALRLRPTRVARASARLVTVGYALPGSVVAVCVFMTLAWVDDRIGGAIVLTGTLVGLVLAYVVRFASPALQASESQMARIPTSMDAAARSLGASPGRLLSEIHVPLLAPGIATAGLLVFVEVMKELPATVLLRPFGLDTLAVAVWEATRESLFETAAFPALLIVAVGLVPVIVLVRVTDRRIGPGPSSAVSAPASVPPVVPPG